MIEAGMHAREWATVNVALYVAYELVTNGEMRDLLENLTWYIIPVVNMDGYDYSWRKDRTWRKNTVKCRADSLDCRACAGVDLNRNFDVHWNGKSVAGI
uniref:Peptidase M14 carboxypeptidase A domain-containing protein n=1 Tax=Romanomermis culicivorax TaxID=13658 RepID=A0A915KP98_ROMCU